MAISILNNIALAGLNAVPSVEGVPISNTTNAVRNAINGVTLNLTAPTLGTPVSLTVAADTTSVTTAINNFVTTRPGAAAVTHAVSPADDDGKMAERNWSA
jgi:Flagellar hook-associated protein 2 C-terminus